jgi:hypothetical protein
MEDRNRFGQPMHCKKIWIYIFPEKEVRGLSPNFHIHVSVGDLYIPMFGSPIFLQQIMQTDQVFKFSVLCLCSV